MKEHPAPLTRAFRQLYHLRYPIRHMSVADAYGPPSTLPRAFVTISALAGFT